jgi:AcrR family transcriptional regulator
MARTATKLNAGPRKGTATTAEGQATVARILEVTRDILTNADAGELSMRNVAARAGLHLANVQYYFRTREDLVRALITDTGERYQRWYDQLIARAGPSPLSRFQAIVRFNLEDGYKPETRALFVQFWALLNELDAHTGRLLGELYAINVAQLGRALAAVYPTVPPEEISRRTTLIAALTEGLMVVRGPQGARSPEADSMIDRAFDLAMQIAAGMAPREAAEAQAAPASVRRRRVR